MSESYFHARALLQVHTVGVGVAIGQSCMLLSAGTKGKRFMLPHATGMYIIMDSSMIAPRSHDIACMMVYIVQLHELQSSHARDRQ